MVTRMAVEAADGTRGRLINVALPLRAISIKESTRRLQNQIFTTGAPTWRARDVGGKRHLWDRWNPYYGRRA